QLVVDFGPAILDVLEVVRKPGPGEWRQDAGQQQALPGMYSDASYFHGVCLRGCCPSRANWRMSGSLFTRALCTTEGSTALMKTKSFSGQPRKRCLPVPASIEQISCATRSGASSCVPSAVFR